MNGINIFIEKGKQHRAIVNSLGMLSMFYPKPFYKFDICCPLIDFHKIPLGIFIYFIFTNTYDNELLIF